MNIYLDNIIFNLKEAGGVAVYWAELIKRLLKDNENVQFIESSIYRNIFRQELDIRRESILIESSLPIKILRYLPLQKAITEFSIFHSSYYRICNQVNVLNITTVHDFTYEIYRKGLPKYVHTNQKKQAIKKANGIICVSENTKKDLLKFYPQIKEEHVKIVYNGVSQDYYPILQMETNAIKQLIPFESKEYILYVGDRRSDYKNFRILVEACQIVKMPLVMVGGGRLSKYEESILKIKLGAIQYIQLNGITNMQLNQLYNHAAFLVYPSLNEGFGIPIIEAQKAGCPVICSDQSSIPEVAGKGAFVINEISALKIVEILNQNKSTSGVINSMIEQGFFNAQRFSWDKCYQQTKQVYSEVYSQYF